MAAVWGLSLRALISSLPPMAGICMSVITRPGTTRFSTSSASMPFEAASTANPRSWRKRHTVWRITMESSTTKATTGIRTPQADKDLVAILEQSLFKQNNTQTDRQSYRGHIAGEFLHNLRHRGRAGRWERSG